MKKPVSTVVAPSPAQGPWPHVGEIVNDADWRNAIIGQIIVLIPTDRLLRYLKRGPRGSLIMFPTYRGEATGAAGDARRTRHRITCHGIAPTLTDAMLDAGRSALLSAWADLVMQGIDQPDGTLLDNALFPRHALDARSVAGLSKVAGVGATHWIHALEYALSDLLEEKDARSLYTVFVRALREIIDREPNGVLVTSATMHRSAQRLALRITKQSHGYVAELVHA